jgi:hypothetical protein
MARRLSLGIDAFLSLFVANWKKKKIHFQYKDISSEIKTRRKYKHTRIFFSQRFPNGRGRYGEREERKQRAGAFFSLFCTSREREREREDNNNNNNNKVTFTPALKRE